MALKWQRELLSEYRAFCAAHADPAIVTKYARYFKEGFDAYGVDSNTLIAFRTELLGKYAAKLDVAACYALGDLALASGKYEDGSLALGLGQHCLKATTAEHLPLLERWLDEGVVNWAIGDTLCSVVIGPLLVRGTLTPGVVSHWARAASRWRRRALPVGLIPLAKKTKQIPPLLKITEPLMGDAERVVHQGQGWFLRECWKLDPAPVETLLLKHVATGPRLIYQYACEKMTAEQKARFKRPKA